MLYSARGFKSHLSLFLLHQSQSIFFLYKLLKNKLQLPAIFFVIPKSKKSKTDSVNQSNKDLSWILKTRCLILWPVWKKLTEFLFRELKKGEKTIRLQQLTLDIKENNFLINLLPFIISLIPVSANKIQQGIFFYTTIT